MALEEALLAEDGILDSHLEADIIAKSNVEVKPSVDVKITGSHDDGDDEEDNCQVS